MNRFSSSSLGDQPTTGLSSGVCGLRSTRRQPLSVRGQNALSQNDSRHAVWGCGEASNLSSIHHQSVKTICVCLSTSSKHHAAGYSWPLISRRPLRIAVNASSVPLPMATRSSSNIPQERCILAASHRLLHDAYSALFASLTTLLSWEQSSVTV